MMSQQAKQTRWWSEPVNVFARIPEDHILRRLNASLDLDLIREEVASKYGRNGQVSVDPVVLMKMMLLLFLDDVTRVPPATKVTDATIFTPGNA